MKLSGNKKNGRHVAARGSARNNGRMQENPAKIEDPAAARAATKKKRARRVRRIIISVLLILVALITAAYCMLKFSVQPPPEKPRTTVNPSSDPDPSQSPDSIVPGSTGDRKSPYARTFVVLGMDDGRGNTDTIMVGKFDPDNHTINVINIPRDTLVNVKWNIKKANSLYAYGGIDGVIDGLAKILGFPVDFYVIVDLDAFKKLVDAVDGVEFDVPKDMRYSDPAQNLEINLKKGYQTLDGDKALQLVRARTNVWASGDIGRIEMQQAFLKAAAAQIIEKKDKLDLKEIIDVFFNNVKTSLKIGEIGWLAREFYKMDAESITFQTLPANYNDHIAGSSYVTINVDEWLQLLNEKINPFKEDIKAEDLSIYTRDSNGKLYVTDGVYAGNQSWGRGTATSGGGSSTHSPSPSPSANGNETATPSSGASPSPDASPSPGTSPSSGTSPSPSPSPSPSAPATPDTSPSPDNTETPSPSPTPDPPASASPGTDDTPESPVINPWA